VPAGREVRDIAIGGDIAIVGDIGIVRDIGIDWHPVHADQLLLTAGSASATIESAVGGRIGQINVDGQPLLIDPDPDGAPTVGWGSFPMAPWAGRIGDGQFRFDGRDHQLDRNHLDRRADGSTVRHAIHGTVFDQRWEVIDRNRLSVTLRCDTHGNGGWDFRGTARQQITLSSDHILCELAVAALDRPFPAVIGWHPWFIAPDDLRFRPDSMYLKDRDRLPTGAMVEPAAGPWDDCFVNTNAVTLVYDREVAARVTVASDCNHLVVYNESAHATCVEPQSGPPDGPNLDCDVVTPGHPLVRTMTIAWSAPTGR
jgi:aldose 1-epimerase